MSYDNIPEAELEVFRNLKNVKVVFDVGARDNVDYLKIKPNIELHAFEPVPMFFNDLALEADKIPGNGKVYLNMYGLGDDTRQAFWGGESPVTKKFIQLPVRTLDGYIDRYKIKRIDFLKIDAEGYDYKVLLGGKKAIALARYIQYEHWDNKQQFHDLLENDFVLHYIGKRNVLCVRKGEETPLL